MRENVSTPHGSKASAIAVSKNLLCDLISLPHHCERITERSCLQLFQIFYRFIRIHLCTSRLRSHHFGIKKDFIIKPVTAKRPLPVAAKQNQIMTPLPLGFDAAICLCKNDDFPKCGVVQLLLVTFKTSHSCSLSLIMLS